MNLVLFGSSVILGFLTIMIGNPSLVVVAGIATSIWNHGATSMYAQWIDRLIITVCAVSHFNLNAVHTSLTLSAIILFGISKILKYTWPHVAAHIVITIVNVHS